MIGSTVVLTAAATACTWNNPGADPYRGPVVDSVSAAVARYNIDPTTRALLVEKVRSLDPDTTVFISRNEVRTTDGLAGNLRDMHFGRNRVCKGPVVRDAWAADHKETAMVYCANKVCIAVPIICGNVSLIDYVPYPRGAEPEFRAWGGPIVPRTVPAPQPVPEPTTLALVAIAIAGLALARRKKMSKEKSKWSAHTAPGEFPDTYYPDVPYKVEPGQPLRLQPYTPDPRPQWQRRFAYIGIAITIGACLAAIFAR